MAKTVLDVIMERIDEQKESSMEFLKTGGPKDFAQYKEVTGLIRGLEVSKSIINDLLRKEIENDDE